MVDVEVDAETQAEISDAAAESLNADLKPEMDNFETLRCSKLKLGLAGLSHYCG